MRLGNHRLVEGNGSVVFAFCLSLEILDNLICRHSASLKSLFV